MIKMHRGSYIKKNSHTQRQADNCIYVVSEILRVVGITHMQWLELFFETGCLNVERGGPSPVWAMEMLTDERQGYWARYMAAYIQDDEHLLTMHPEEYLKHNYHRLKMQLVDEEV